MITLAFVCGSKTAEDNVGARPLSGLPLPCLFFFFSFKFLTVEVAYNARLLLLDAS